MTLTQFKQTVYNWNNNNNINQNVIFQEVWRLRRLNKQCIIKISASIKILSFKNYDVNVYQTNSVELIYQHQ